MRIKIPNAYILPVQLVVSQTMEFSLLVNQVNVSIHCEYKTYSTESVRSCKAWNYEIYFLTFHEMCLKFYFQLLNHIFYLKIKLE